jgi:hypothetical protein
VYHGKSYGLVHKEKGCRFIGGALTHTAPQFIKKIKIDIKRWAKVYQRITKNIETIFAVRTIAKTA